MSPSHFPTLNSNEGQKEGWFFTHKHRLGREILCFKVRIPIKPHLLGLDEPLKGREQLCYPKGGTQRCRRVGSFPEAGGAWRGGGSALHRAAWPGVAGLVSGGPNPSPYRKAANSAIRTPTSAPKAAAATFPITGCG